MSGLKKYFIWPKDLIHSTFISYSTIHLKVLLLPLKKLSNTIFEESILTLCEHPFLIYLVWRQKILEKNSYHNTTCAVIVLTFVFVFLIDCSEQIFSKRKCNLSTLSQIIFSINNVSYFWHMTVLILFYKNEVFFIFYSES